MSTGELVLIYLLGLGAFTIAYAARQFGWQGLMNRLFPKRKTILNISGTFENYTLSGFKVEYAFSLLCERVDKEEFARARLNERNVQDALLEAYHAEVFRPLLYNEPYFLCLGSGLSSKNLRHFDIASPVTLHGLSKDQKVWGSDPPFAVLKSDLARLPAWKRSGCTVAFESFAFTPIRPELVKENYAMLTDAQIERIQQDERFSALQEQIAVAALKLRQDLLNHNEQRHETEEIVIETTKAGRGLRIRWHFKGTASREYELLGFRTTGGFFHDKWSETHNGVLVVDSHIDGHVVEFLKEGEPTFYTFFLREKEIPKKRKRKLCSPIRFQVTIAAKDELEEIQKVLVSASEEKAPDPRMTEIISELGLVMEFHEAMDSMEQSLVAKIKNKRLPKDEEEDKLLFVRDAVRLQREKYQP